MKEVLEQAVRTAIKSLIESGEKLPPDIEIQIERARDTRHGDFSCNVAMAAAKSSGRKPRELAEAIIARLAPGGPVERVEIAGPGFINFFVRRRAFLDVISEINRDGASYPKLKPAQVEKILVEFVSANPTGPLHIGHGRGASYGSALANLLAAAGHPVSREYYVNDAGRQMDILALSVWLRYLQHCGRSFEFPQQAYRGEYVNEISAKLLAEAAKEFDREPGELFLGLPPDSDGDARLDELVSRARRLLGPGDFARVHKFGLDEILADIRNDLAEFGVTFDRWYSERSILDRDLVTDITSKLKKSGDLYEKDGAWWLRSSSYGDEKDRVVVRENGQHTYLAPDIAYHREKFERGFDRLIDVWGADHHGYMPRMKAALQALGRDPSAFEVLFVQFATLYRGSERVQMSTRSGEFITLRELRGEVGNDAARFFYVMRRSDQHLDFDLDLAKKHSNDNPVYYIQYAHARICSVLRQLHEKNLAHDPDLGERSLERLDAGHETSLLNVLSRFPEVIAHGARDRAPHVLPYYLQELANNFHAYYNSEQFLVDDAALRNARLNLILAVRQVIRNGMTILGVSTPETM